MLADKVYIIGVSPLGASSVSGEALNLVHEAELIFGGQRLLDMFPAVTAQKIRVGGDLNQTTAVIKANIGLKRMVVLASGDPNFYGIARNLQQALGARVLEIFPNVSSMQLAFARIKESWDDAVFASVHSRSLKGLADAVKGHHKVCILTDENNIPSEVARELLSRGIENCKVFVCQDLGSDREQIVETDLIQAAQKSFSSLNVMIIIRPVTEKPAESTQLLGIADERFLLRSQEKSLITKLEIRAVSLAKLGLTENSIVWDIGAGSGAVSIEASLLARGGSVFAVEKNSGDVAVIRENVKRFKRKNIEIIEASAPEGLEGLPDPSAVFIGGSGGKMSQIVEVACARLKTGGRIVANLATLENLQTLCHELEVKGFATETTLVNIARSRPVLDLTRLEALNPVFVVAGWRKNEGAPKSE